MSEQVANKELNQPANPELTSASSGSSVLIPVVTNSTEEGRSVTGYIVIGILVLGLLLLIGYYAYKQFIDNSCSKENMAKGTEQERDDPVVDFNLREAIRDLQGLQKNILSQLSENSSI